MLVVPVSMVRVGCFLSLVGLVKGMRLIDIVIWFLNSVNLRTRSFRAKMRLGLRL